MAETELPSSLTINAWTGDAEPPTSLSKEAEQKWSVRREFAKYSRRLAADPPADLRDWRNQQVGWGLVLPDNQDLTEAERATAIDAPEPIQNLLASRPGSPVLRYPGESPNSILFLRRYDACRKAQDLHLGGGPRGVGEGCLPWYLLIYASPSEIPWGAQYRLNLCAFVGRIDLQLDDGLENYVDALIHNWADSACKRESPVVWSVDHGGSDISHLMRITIAEPVLWKFKADTETQAGVRWLSDRCATGSNLIEALTAAKPALIVTTSHGMTGPLTDLQKMKAQLGLLVDDKRTPLYPASLLHDWQPDGAVWYAHACCSAGGDNKTRYQDLVAAGSGVANVLNAVAGLGARVAPLPRALLGANKPLRAFIGHVEPTFDWTIRQPDTNQGLADTLCEAIYSRMYSERPEMVGQAFDRWYRQVGTLLSQWDDLVGAINEAGDPSRRQELRRKALATKLTALDRQSLVILGDPTAAVPPVPSPG